MIKKTSEIKPSKQQLQGLLECYKEGRYQETEKLALFLSSQFPNHNFSWNILSLVLKKTGRISEAVIAGKRAIEINTMALPTNFLAPSFNYSALCI